MKIKIAEDIKKLVTRPYQSTVVRLDLPEGVTLQGGDNEGDGVWSISLRKVDTAELVVDESKVSAKELKLDAKITGIFHSGTTETTSDSINLNLS